MKSVGRGLGLGLGLDLVLERCGFKYNYYSLLSEPILTAIRFT